jgi:hypothetical protein
MGQLVTTIAGGVIGFAIGGPFGAQVGMMLGGMIGATLFGPTVHGPRLNDLKVTASTYGVPIPEIYGTVRVGGNLIWTSGIRETKKSSRPGKGGPKQVTYTYDATFAMGLCKGPIDEVLRIWADSKLIYDSTTGATRQPASSSDSVFTTILVTVLTAKKKKKNINVRVYRGTEEQLPDSLIEAKEGVGNVSAHRGMAYVVFERLQLEDFGNRIPQMTFEVTKSKTAGVLALPARFSTGDVETSEPRDWLPDFSTGRLLAFDKPDSLTRLYNLADMKQVAEQPAMAFNISERGYSLISEENRFLVSGYPTGTGFSFYNIATLSQISGHNASGGTTNAFNSATQQVTLTPNGRVGHGRFLTGEASGIHIVHSDWQGNIFLMDSQGRLLSQIDAPFAPTAFVEGRRDSSGSQIIGWRAGNSQLELFIIETPGSASYTTVQEGGSTTWVPYTGYTTRSVSLRINPLEKFLPLAVLYDPTDDHVFCFGVDPEKYSKPNQFNNRGGVRALKYSLATETYKFRKIHENLPAPSGLTQNMRSSRLSGGTFGWVAKPRIGTPILAQINLQSGNLESSARPDGEFMSGFDGSSDQFWDDETNSMFAVRVENGQTTATRLALSESVFKVTIPAIVEDICLRSGVLVPEDLDLTELAEAEVVGYSMDRLTTARDALKQLATAFLFDAYESDYMLKFRSRGSDPITNIPEDWVVRQGEDGLIKETITQELEMPLRMTVNYYDVERDHQQHTQSAKRKVAPYPTMWTAKEDVVELPMSWDADSAKQCADKLLKMAWANRTGYQFNLPWRYLKYDPTDVVTVTLESGTVYNMRLTDANIGGDFTVEAEAVSENAAAYVSTATGASSEAPPQTLDGDGSAFPIVINTPLLRDVDYDTTGLSYCYVSAGTNEVSFNGTAVYIDDGIDYQAVGVISGQTTSGYAVNALPATTSYESTDEKTVLLVRLSDPSMELESISQDDMLNFEGNSALVGNEVIQFRDAELLPSGEWALTGILRARRGTNYAVRDHSAGEGFLMIDATSVTKFARPPESYVTNRSFKAAPISVSLSDVTPTTASLVPRDLMPYTPEAVAVTDDGTELTVKAERRSRVTAPLQNSIGTIPYREGDMLSARMTFSVWFGKTLADVAPPEAPDFTEAVTIFDTAGNDLPLESSIPLASLGSEDTILIRIVENGIVEGTPKWVEATRIAEDQWNLTEFY